MPMIRWIVMLFVLPLLGCFGEARIVETQVRELDATAAERMLVVVGAGDLLIEGVEGLETIEVSYDLATQRNVLSEDDAAIEALEVEFLSDSDGQVRLLISLDEAPSGYYVDVRVRAPAHLLLEVDDDSGDVWIRDFGGLDLRDGSGDVEIERITNAVLVDDGSGDLLLDNVGATTVQDSSGDVTATNVRGDLRIDDGDGDISVEQVAGRVSLMDGSGEIEVRDVDSDLVIIDGSGGIDVDRIAGRVSIEDGSGDIVVGDVGGLDVVSNGSGEVVRR